MAEDVTPADWPGDKPTASRVYDRLVGGSHSFGVDREMAADLLAVEPDAGFWAFQNRAFVGRALRWSLDAGVRQVLDIGAGIPDTAGAPHQLTGGYQPAVRVVYVDHDPVAVASALFVAAERERAGIGDVAALDGDLLCPGEILAHPTVVNFCDLGRPVVLLLGAVLHFVSDADDPAGVIAVLRDAVAAGSVLVVSHASVPQEMSPEQVRVVREYSERTAPLTLRSRDQVAELLAVFGEVAVPGVVKVADWRPDEEHLTERERQRRNRIPGWVGVAVKSGVTW
ncbi:SAM-dependent methyltransferase [Phytohabitans rumicis]|uniref:S-adenosyl methyltransferase n=1 Tax=Phytohabitans rumicis TaxID=1076125 RepID=A0A6V8LAE5_9ACTN|nr:SAM-dependent methyltransferase [Phytohabitans rumicis]GFJ91046.1 hypothetical protein Prum_046880 [Phytohabitans rumicis]